MPAACPKLLRVTPLVTVMLYFKLAGNRACLGSVLRCWHLWCRGCLPDGGCSVLMHPLVPGTQSDEFDLNS